MHNKPADKRAVEARLSQLKKDNFVGEQRLQDPIEVCRGRYFWAFSDVCHLPINHTKLVGGPVSLLGHRHRGCTLLDDSSTSYTRNVVSTHNADPPSFDV